MASPVAHLAGFEEALTEYAREHLRENGEAKWQVMMRSDQNARRLREIGNSLVGKLFVTIMQAIDGPLTRDNFLKAVKRQPYDIGGVKVDFTTDNQGSDFVQATVLRDGQFIAVTPQELVDLFK